ncbi:MAG: DUF5706 domain-containing protein [Syntrophorhabdaceae bacterium]|nr:DUF5706 domain-containing protein [Syntrophorhabdaceae bacterium]
MKIEQPGSHIDHLLSITRNHHIQLSSMADLKANILLTMASLVITFSVRYITEMNLRYVAFTLIAFCIITIVMAAYAVMPKVPLKINEAKKNLKDPNFNLLFFGDFQYITYEEFKEEIEEALNDPSKTYELALKEIYTLGKFLQKKYFFVKLAYISLIAGFLASGFMMIMTVVMHQ